MLTAPAIPPVIAPDLANALGGFPFHFDFSPLAMGIVLALVAIFFAVVTVVLVYHWRRFPFDQEVFDRVERWYFVVSGVLLAVSLIGILFTA